MSDDDHIARQGKPPRNGQFKPGQSGNPKGRPKGAKSFRTHILEQLGRKVTVIEQGRRRTMSRGEAIALQLVNKAAAGDPKSLAAILHVTRQLDEASTAFPKEGLGQQEDALVMQSILERLRAAGAEQKNNWLAGQDGMPGPNPLEDDT
jgi:hypothetical protein